MYFTSFVLERNGYKLGSMTLYNADEVIAIFDDNNKFIQACVWTSDDKFHLVNKVSAGFVNKMKKRERHEIEFIVPVLKRHEEFFNKIKNLI